MSQREKSLPPRAARPAAGAKVSKAEYEQLAEFRYQLRKFLRFSEEAARSCDLTPHQHQALLAIEGFPGRDRVTVKELAERLQIKQNTAVELVNRLERRELVLRHANDSDRRGVLLSITPQGRALLRRLTMIHREELGYLEPRLSGALRRFVGSSGDDG